MTSAAATAHDPVCHMDIDPNTAAATAEHEGVTYYFCAVGCQLEFKDDPAAVLAAEAAHDHSEPMDHDMHGGGAKRPWWKFWG